MAERGAQPRSPVATPVGVRAVFANRDFAIFWSAALLSNSGTWMQNVAVAAHLWEQTHSATWLGAMGFSSMIPAVFLTPFAGVLADRLPRRLILAVTQILQMCLAFGFFVVYQMGELSPWRTIGLLTATGLVAGIQLSAWQSFVPTLVPRPHLVTAVRLNSVQFQASRAIGPLGGAIALGFFGVGASFLTNALTFVPVVIAVIVARPVASAVPKQTEPVLASLADGFRYTWSRPAMRHTVLAACMLSALGQSLVQLTAAMAGELYDKPSEANAGLVAAFGVGSVISGFLLVASGERLLQSTILRAGMATYVIGVAVIPMTSQYRFGILALLVCGLAHIPVATTFNTFMQSAVPDHFRGRVISCYLTGVMLGMPLGAFALGRLGDAIGMRATIIVDVVLMATFAGILFLRLNGMRYLDDAVADAAREESRTSMAGALNRAPA